MLVQQQQQADLDRTAAVQSQLQTNTAAINSRYGALTALAVAGAGK